MGAPRVIALEWNLPMLVDVLAELSRQYSWQPIYCVSYNLQDRVNELLPSAIYHDTYDARFGWPAAKLAGMPLGIIDQPTAEALAYAEVISLKQMDRMDVMGTFALHDRFIHFHRLAGYWSAVYDTFQPDVVLMPTSPHVTYDYVAYAVARHRGIRIILFEYVTTEGMLMAVDGFEDGLPQLMAAYQKARANRPFGPVQLSSRMDDYWQRLKGSYDKAIPAGTVQVLTDAERIKRAEAAREQYFKIELNNPLEVPRKIARVLRRDYGEKLPRPFRSKPQLAPPPAVNGFYRERFYKEAPGNIGREAMAFRKRHVEELIRRHDELTSPPDFSRKYIYVALHLQPERSTNPNGGVFDDQHVIINMIASVLPPGWRIYIKEHPSQLVPQYASDRGRWPSLYAAALEHPAVQLMPRQTPSFDLIDHARAVATICGTSSWEAVVRGVPTLLFGEAWYKGCDGVYSVRTKVQCRQAIERIASGERPDPQAVRLFLRTAEECSFVGYLSGDDMPFAGIDEATNIAQLARAIDERYRLPKCKTSS